jgi:hypothetical protein
VFLPLRGDGDGPNRSTILEPPRRQPRLAKAKFLVGDYREPIKTLCLWKFDVENESLNAQWTFHTKASLRLENQVQGKGRGKSTHRCISSNPKILVAMKYRCVV